MKDHKSNEIAKKKAGEKGALYVSSGQLVGLGTGSTTRFAIQELGRRVREEGLEIECVTTSMSSLFLAREAGLMVHPLQTIERIDISLDGADEVDPRLNLIKGGGAAHTLEKLVHSMSDRFLVLVDSSKMSHRLGEKFSVPVEVIKEAGVFVQRRLLDLGAADAILRSGGPKDGPIITENGNLVIDARFPEFDPEDLEGRINQIPGVLSNGIFLSSRIPVERVIIGGEDGVDEITQDGG